MGVTRGAEADDDFRRFVLESSPALSRVAYLLVGDHQLAEDLLQSVLANAYRHWSRVRTGNPYAYVRYSLHHQQISWWRRHRLREHLAPDPPERTSGGDPAGPIADQVSLERALATLTPRQRAVIVLRYYEDLTELQTAEQLDLSVGTVKRHAHDALARLRSVAPALLEIEEVIHGTA